MAYPLTRIFLFPILKFFIKDIKGVKNLPKKGPFIIAANHQSDIDGPVMFYILFSKLKRKAHFYTLNERIGNPFFTFIFVKVYECIKTNGSLKTGLDAIKNGGIVGLFPEGQRTWTGEIQKVKRTGLGALALISKVPVVPVGIRGAYELWPRQRLVFRLKKVIQLNIGEPMRFNKKLNKKNASYVVKTVMKKIARLAGQEYPG